MNNDDGDGVGDGYSDSGSTLRARSSSLRSDPFDEELPKDFNPRKLEWFFSPRPDPKKPISMFWTDHEDFYAVPSPEPASTEKSEEPKEKLGTMGLLEKWYVPRREETNMPKWTIGAPLPNLPLRRVSVDANDISHFSLARPPTPPRKSPTHLEETMSDKPLPPLPHPRRIMSVGDRPLFARARSQSTPAEVTLAMGYPSASESATERDLESFIDSYEHAPQMLTSSGENSRENDSRDNDPDHIPGPYLLRRLQHYHDDQIEAIARMEVALGNPNLKQSLRSQFLTWSQQLLDIHSPFFINTNPAYGEEVKITEKDAHTVVDWSINVGIKMNITQEHLFDCLNAGDVAQAQLRSMKAGIDIYHDSHLVVEELYHKMSELVRNTCRSPRVHEVSLLVSFLFLYDRLIYSPFATVMHRMVVVRDEVPHDPVAIPLNIATPLSLLKSVLDNACKTYQEYTNLTREIRGEFFVPIENRIPGVSSRTQGYLDNVVGPSNVI